MNRHPEAIAHLLEAIDLKPDFGAAHFNLGAEYLALGRHADALAETRRALALDPGLDIGHFQVGLICAASGDGACARREHEILMKTNAGLAARLLGKIDENRSPGGL